MPLVRVFTFLAVLVTASVLAHTYVYRRLAVDPAWEAPIRRRIGIAIGLLAMLPIFGMVIMRVASRAVGSPFVWAGMAWMGLLFLLLITLLALDAVKLVARVFCTSGPRSATTSSSASSRR
jgi:hypothetical protein